MPELSHALKPGLLRAILRQVQVDVELLLEQLGQRKRRGAERSVTSSALKHGRDGTPLPTTLFLVLLLATLPKGLHIPFFSHGAFKEVGHLLNPVQPEFFFHELHQRGADGIRLVAALREIHIGPRFLTLRVMVEVERVVTVVWAKPLGDERLFCGPC